MVKKLAVSQKPKYPKQSVRKGNNSIVLNYLSILWCFQKSDDKYKQSNTVSLFSLEIISIVILFCFLIFLYVISRNCRKIRGMQIACLFLISSPEFFLLLPASLKSSLHKQMCCFVFLSLICQVHFKSLVMNKIMVWIGRFTKTYTRLEY